jgi:ATP-dependent DNA helicase DinG
VKEKSSQQSFLERIFSKEGVLSHSLKNFEERLGQKEMSEQVFSAYENDSIALIEAGTGTGKSLAYLVPAVYWALERQEKTVISTHTIALQEQLLHKDVPFLLKAMDVELEVCLVKGMGNYLCLRKLRELQDQPLLFSVGAADGLQAIEVWAERTQEGSRSDIPFSVPSATWEKIAAERGTCNHVRCPHYKECFFFKARKKASDSQLLIVNHHLLLADIEQRRRNPTQESLFPPYKRLVIDEAHHLEDVALDSFSQKFERNAFLHQLAKVYSDSHPERSRIPQLLKELSSLPVIPPLLLHKLEVEIPVQRRACQTAMEETFTELMHFVEVVLPYTPAPKDREVKKRITASLTEHPFWKQTLVKSLDALSTECLRFAQMLKGILTDLEEFKKAPLYEKLAISLLEIEAALRGLEFSAAFLDQFTQEGSTEKRVRWLESSGSHFALVDASLDISAVLNEHLFSQQRTSVLCSATIATAKSFSFFKKRLGLLPYGEKVREGIFESPFNYQERTLFVVPTDLPVPSSPQFLTACTQAISEIVEVSQGSVFLLFTSYDMLHNCHRALVSTELSQRYPFLKQGEMPRHLLLERFKKKEGNVLFATDSFWEGVDVPGEALRCVVIAKLPFLVPSDPLYEAYAQSLEEEGLNPFFDYSVPQAVIKFKQGFGRLMRNNADRGCVVCLDHRVVKKNYGRQFLESLPSCRTCFGPQKEALSQMRLFYKETLLERSGIEPLTSTMPSLRSTN